MLWLTVHTLSDIYDVPPPSLFPRYVITFLVCHFPLSLSFLDTFLILFLLMCLVLRCISNAGERGRESKRKTEIRSQKRRTQATGSVFYNTKQMLIPMNGMFFRGNGAAMTHLLEVRRCCQWPSHLRCKYITSHHAASFGVWGCMWVSVRLKQSSRAEKGIK